MNYELLFNLMILALGGGCLVVAVLKGLFRPDEWLLGDRGGEGKQSRGEGGGVYLAGGLGAFIASAIFPSLVVMVERSYREHADNLPLTTRQQALGLFVGGLIGAGVVIGLWRMIRRVEGPAIEGGVAAGVRGAVAGAGWMVLWVPVVMAVSTLAMWIVTMVRQEPPNNMAHVLLGTLVDPREPLVWRAMLMAGVVVMAPVMEEIVYRGLLLPGLARATGSTSVAIGGCSAIFAMMHWGSVPEGTFGAVGPTLFVLALGLGLVYVRTRSILAPIVMHALFNAGNIGVALYYAAHQPPTQ